MKKILIVVETDSYEKIKFISDSLKSDMVIIPSGTEVWEIDEQNNMRQRI